MKQKYRADIDGLRAIAVLPTINHQAVRDLLSWLGLLLIAISVFFYTHDTDFPGFAAVLPTIGAALIIYAGSHGQSYIGRVLSERFFVFIGLISYSLYLWHWPVIVYTQYYVIKELGVTETGVMLMVTFVLSVLSWHCIEKPFRRPILITERSVVFKMSLTALILTLGIGLQVAIKDGLPYRYEGDLSQAVNLDDAEWERWGNCENVLIKLSHDQELCGIGETSVPPDFIFWGDSHARAMASAVDLAAKNNAIGGKVAIRPACPPLLSIERQGRVKCHNFNEAVLQYIKESPEIKTVILAARWALVTNGTRYKKESGKFVRLVDVQASEVVSTTNVELFELGIRRTVKKLQAFGKKVILVMPVPEIGFDVPSANFVAARTGRDVNSIISPLLSEYHQRVKSVTTVFASLEKEKLVKIIDPSKILCDNKQCKVNIGENALYRDDDHLSTFGSRYLSPLFSTAFEQVSRL